MVICSPPPFFFWPFVSSIRRLLTFIESLFNCFQSIEVYTSCFAEIQMVENDKLRNGNREALTALRKRARTTKSSVPSSFESIMKGVGGTSSRPLVQEVCTTCGNHDAAEQTWMMFPGTDVFARIPFHAAHTILETGFLLFHPHNTNQQLPSPTAYPKRKEEKGRRE